MKLVLVSKFFKKVVGLIYVEARTNISVQLIMSRFSIMVGRYCSPSQWIDYTSDLITNRVRKTNTQLETR